MQTCQWCLEEGTALKKCTGCRTNHYCKTACQSRDWPYHRMKCLQIQQATLAAAGTDAVDNSPAAAGTGVISTPQQLERARKAYLPGALEFLRKVVWAYHTDRIEDVFMMSTEAMKIVSAEWFDCYSVGGIAMASCAEVYHNLGFREVTLNLYVLALDLSMKTKQIGTEIQYDQIKNKLALACYYVTADDLVKAQQWYGFVETGLEGLTDYHLVTVNLSLLECKTLCLVKQEKYHDAVELTAPKLALCYAELTRMRAERIEGAQSRPSPDNPPDNPMDARSEYTKKRRFIQTRIALAHISCGEFLLLLHRPMLAYWQYMCSYKLADKYQWLNLQAVAQTGLAHCLWGRLCGHTLSDESPGENDGPGLKSTITYYASKCAPNLNNAHYMYGSTVLRAMLWHAHAALDKTEFLASALSNPSQLEQNLSQAYSSVSTRDRLRLLLAKIYWSQASANEHRCFLPLARDVESKKVVAETSTEDEGTNKDAETNKKWAVKEFLKFMFVIFDDARYNCMSCGQVAREQFKFDAAGTALEQKKTKINQRTMKAYPHNCLLKCGHCRVAVFCNKACLDRASCPNVRVNSAPLLLPHNLICSILGQMKHHAELEDELSLLGSDEVAAETAIKESLDETNRLVSKFFEKSTKTFQWDA